MNVIKKLIGFLSIIVLFTLFHASVSFAQTFPAAPKQEIFKAKVMEIIDEGERVIGEFKNPFQKVKVRILEGSDKDKELTIDHGGTVSIREEQKVKEGETIVLSKFSSPQRTYYQIIDKYRLDSLLYIVIFFFVLVLALSRWKGLGSIIGLAISLLVIVKFIVPQILEGKDPLFVSIIGSLFIMITTIYLAHGFSKRTSVALGATVIALILTGIISFLFVDIVKLSGLGGEGAYNLSFGQTGVINFKGLLLGGMIIGALGVLDDITTSLSAAIFELNKANNKLGFFELAKSGLSIGREHISSLVNTLALAYAGASLPIFLLIILNPAGWPLWAILNSEIIIEEVIRTLAGSIGLILAVPLTAVFASWVSTMGSSNISTKPTVNRFIKGKRGDVNYGR
ncbi:MAG: hypothetical protein ACD_50C00388G0004 [uncultured bacterium]|nr:MAG: hypothetical protein ACD_50C00388G0004 [uncultured bacterium]